MSNTISYFERMKLIKLGLLPAEAVPKERKPIKRISDKKAAQNKEDKEMGSTSLDKWFKAREQDIIDSGGVCWETGDEIPKAYYRHSTAHIFPKSIFLSVATHDLNFIVLSAANGSHSKFDTGVDEAKKMKVFGEAVERYLQFKHLITEKHKYLSQFEEAAQEYLEKKKALI